VLSRGGLAWGSTLFALRVRLPSLSRVCAFPAIKEEKVLQLVRTNESFSITLYIEALSVVFLGAFCYSFPMVFHLYSSVAVIGLL